MSASVRDLDLPPGPRGRRLRNFFEQGRDFPAMMRRLHEEYGGIVYYQMPRMNFCALFEPDAVREVVELKADIFPSYNDPAGFGIIGTKCLPRDHGEHHQQVSEVVGGGFGQDRMPRYADLIADNINDMAAGWRPGQVIDYQQEMGRFTCSSLLDAIFGRTPRIAPEVAWNAVEAIKRDWVMSYLPGAGLLRRLPLPGYGKARDAIQVMDDAVYGAMKKARDPSHSGEDMASHIVRTADQQGGCPFANDLELRDELYMTLLGAIDPPMVALVWSLELLAAHPDVLEKIEQEVDAVVGKRPLEGADYHRLPYTHAVFKESARLRPPSYAATSHWRQASEDCEVRGYRIPAGTIAQTCLGESQRHPSDWDKADEFLPERWLADSPPNKREHAYMPFLVGPHSCPGWEFATMLVVLGIARLAQGMRLELLAPTPFRRRQLGLGVKGPIQTRICERQAAA